MEQPKKGLLPMPHGPPVGGLRPRRIELPCCLLSGPHAHAPHCQRGSLRATIFNVQRRRYEGRRINREIDH
jgi:hypothetical protein